MKKNKKQTTFWVVMYLINTVVLYTLSLFFGSEIVFGNATLPPILAVLITSLLLTGLLTQVEPIVTALKIKITNEAYWGILYGVFNIGGLWLIARISEWSGFGITSFSVAILLGIILNVCQYAAWKILMPTKK